MKEADRHSATDPTPGTTTPTDVELQTLIAELYALRIRANATVASLGVDRLVFVDYLSSMLIEELTRLEGLTQRPHSSDD